MLQPIGARDFLLVTTEADYDSSGFIFASTSADHLWHSPEPGTHSEETDQSSDDSDGYTRSTLRLAGYIGEANAHGGTDLTMYVDLGLAAYVPAWLLKILGDYGLSEIMRRISLAADRAADTLALPAATDPASAAPVAVSPTVTPAKAPTHNSPPTPVSRNSPDAENDANNRFQQSDSWQLREGGEMRSHYTPSRRQSQSWCNADQEDDVFSDLTREAMENIEMYLELEVQPLTPASGSGRSKSDQQTGLNVSSLPPCVSKALKAQLQSSAPATPEHVEPLVLRWQDKGGKAGVQVSNTKVPGSDWCAVRGSVIIHADKHDIRKLVMDDKVSVFMLSSHVL